MPLYSYSATYLSVESVFDFSNLAISFLVYWSNDFISILSGVYSGCGAITELELSGLLAITDNENIDYENLDPLNTTSLLYYYIA